MRFKTKIFLTIAVFVLLSIPISGQNEVLSNNDIVNMTRAGLGKDLIIQKIQSTKCVFKTTTTDLIALKDAGVDEKVISAMLGAKGEPQKPETPRLETPRPEAPRPQPPSPVSAGTPNAKLKTGTDELKEVAVISDAVKEMARQYRDRVAVNDTDDELDSLVGSEYANFFAFAVAQAALGGDPNKSSLQNLQPISFAFETARTDKQIGTSSSSTKSLAQIDKPGFSRLLGFAIDNGLIERGVNDSIMTLSTTPGALFIFGEKDYQKAYEQAGIFNNIGISASFNVTKQDAQLANATRNQLKEYSIRYSLFDRSARSKGFQEIFDRDIKPEIQRLLNATLRVSDVLNVEKPTTELRRSTSNGLKDALKEVVKTSEYTAATPDGKIQILETATFNFLNSAVVAPIRANSILTAGQKTALLVGLKDLLDVQKKISFEVARDNLNKFYKMPQATIAYINHRDVLGNYSELKGLYQRYGTVLKPLTLLLNGGISFYHKPNTLMNQQKVRDASFAVSLEGKIRSPWNDIEDFSPITYSFTGRYSRMYENKGVINRKADLGSFQFLMNFPVFKGFALPLSATYSNATEVERKSGFRFNFGFKLDTDKLFELANLSKAFSR